MIKKNVILFALGISLSSNSIAQRAVNNTDAFLNTVSEINETCSRAPTESLRSSDPFGYDEWRGEIVKLFLRLHWLFSLRMDQQGWITNLEVEILEFTPENAMRVRILNMGIGTVINVFYSRVNTSLSEFRPRAGDRLKIVVSYRHFEVGNTNTGGSVLTSHEVRAGQTYGPTFLSVNCNRNPNVSFPGYGVGFQLREFERI